MTISANPDCMTNRIHCYLATEVERIASPELDATEDLEVILMSRDEVKAILADYKILNAQMVAPLYRYFYLNL